LRGRPSVVQFLAGDLWSSNFLGPTFDRPIFWNRPLVVQFLRARKRGQKWIFSKTSRQSIPYRKPPTWPNFHGFCTIVNFPALFWPREAVKGARIEILPKIGSFDSLSKTAYVTRFSWILNDFKISGPFLASRGRKRGQKCTFTKISRLIRFLIENCLYDPIFMCFERF